MRTVVIQGHDYELALKRAGYMNAFANTDHITKVFDVSDNSVAVTVSDGKSYLLESTTDPNFNVYVKIYPISGAGPKVTPLSLAD